MVNLKKLNCRILLKMYKLNGYYRRLIMILVILNFNKIKIVLKYKIAYIGPMDYIKYNFLDLTAIFIHFT